MLNVTPKFIQTKLLIKNIINIKINANVKNIIEKLRMRGFFHPIKNRPLSNSNLVNNLDAEILIKYNNIIYSLLN